MVLMSLIKNTINLCRNIMLHGLMLKGWQILRGVIMYKSKMVLIYTFVLLIGSAHAEGIQPWLEDKYQLASLDDDHAEHDRQQKALLHRRCCHSLFDAPWHATDRSAVSKLGRRCSLRQRSSTARLGKISAGAFLPRRAARRDRAVRREPTLAPRR